MKSLTTRQLVETALFIAIIVVLGITPIGLIPLGFINVTILCVPVIVGTILMGLERGLLLGACFGLCSMLSMFGLTMTPPSSYASLLAATNPLLAVIMCIVPRLMIPVSTHFMYRLVAKGKENSVIALPASAIAGSLTNTILYLGMMLLFFVMAGLDSAPILALITGTGVIAGPAEAFVAAIITNPIVYAVWRVQHKS